MTEPQEVDLTPAGAAALIDGELSLAEESVREGDVDGALDSYVRALGLALQLGPAPTEQAMTSILQGAREIAHRQDAAGLAALGPALVGLVTQMRKAGALPVTVIMEAWAQFVEGLGALIGQLGLALAIPGDHRSGMMANAQARAALLDDATAGRFALTAWIDGVTP
jgi:hypothetical protein